MVILVVWQLHTGPYNHAGSCTDGDLHPSKCVEAIAMRGGLESRPLLFRTGDLNEVTITDVMNQSSVF